MLLFSKSHFIKDIAVALDGGESGYSETAQQMRQRMRDYATDASGKKAWVQVSYYSTTAKSFTTLIEGITPYPSQRVIYVDGSFDLFSSGHIEFLKAVVAEETARGKSTGWFSAENTHHRIAETGIDYAPLYLVLGLHSDYAVNTEKGANYPIMNIYERTLCTLQCKVHTSPPILFPPPKKLNPHPLLNSQYINALILNAPFTPAASYLHFLPAGRIAAIYHGPHATLENPEGEGNRDPYAAAKEMGLCILMVGHGYADVNAKSIVKRILENRALYEERQRKKGVKMVREKGMVESGH